MTEAPKPAHEVRRITTGLVDTAAAALAALARLGYRETDLVNQALVIYDMLADGLYGRSGAPPVFQRVYADDTTLSFQQLVCRTDSVIAAVWLHAVDGSARRPLPRPDPQGQ